MLKRLRCWLLGHVAVYRRNQTSYVCFDTGRTVWVRTCHCECRRCGKVLFYAPIQETSFVP